MADPKNASTRSYDTGYAVPALRVATPVGDLVLHAAEGAIVAVDWLRPGRPFGRAGSDDATREPGEAAPPLCEAARQLEDYFAGRRSDFELPLAPAGSPFHRSVWRAMQEIPFGETATYGELARKVGGEAQPVGGACGANPIPIFIPCHRVVAADGLGGFSGGGGVESKRFLLHHEGALEPELDLFGPPNRAAG